MANKKHLRMLTRGYVKWNEWRDQNPEVIPDLSSAKIKNKNFDNYNFENIDFREAHLYHCSFRRANLVRSNFWLATLDESNLSGSDLSEAIITDANLWSAIISYADALATDFTGSNLQHINASHANLEEANFSYCNLRGALLDKANFKKAIFQDTILADINFKSINNLDQIQHLGPSVIDLKSILQSTGLPKDFLLGCGLTPIELSVIHLLKASQSEIQFDELLERLLAIRNQEKIVFYSCFISYSHQDRQFARKLFSALQKHGIRCWFDEHDLKPGDTIGEKIERGIGLTDKILLCCSENSLNSWWVENELESAFHKERRAREKYRKVNNVLIPINIDNHIYSDAWTSGYKSQIRKRIIADFSNWQDEVSFNSSFDFLLKGLKLDEFSNVNKEGKSNQ